MAGRESAQLELPRVESSYIFMSIVQDPPDSCYAINGPEWCNGPGDAPARLLLDGDVIWATDATGSSWAWR